MTDDAAERKRKRLEAWRKRQQQQQQEQEQQQQQHQQRHPPASVVTLSLSKAKAIKTQSNRKSIPTVVPSFNPFDDADDEQGYDDDDDVDYNKQNRLDMLIDRNTSQDTSSFPSSSSSSRKKRRRWDVEGVGDALDTFMEKLQEGALGPVSTSEADVALHVNVSGSMMRKVDSVSSTTKPSLTPTQNQPLAAVSAPAVREKELGLSHSTSEKHGIQAIYTPSDWESEVPSEVDTEDDDQEDEARRAFINALKAVPVEPVSIKTSDDTNMVDSHSKVQLHTAAELKTEKQRREDRLKQLALDAEAARHAVSVESEFGRIYNDGEDGIMEEAERNWDTAKQATPENALEVLAELNKKKELKSVDHSQINYMPFRKNLYKVPRALAQWTPDQILNRRAKLKIRVRGKGAPAPITSWTECGLSEKIVTLMAQKEINIPYPIQAQCIPCIMAGRDVIGIAKTGSGKTLAYLLPLLRHIGDQPPLGPLESGPIGLILAPARELAAQIHSVCKHFCKSLGYKSTVVYGGAAVAEQIGDLKRGVHIAVATPGRLIDILTMQSGKILSLHRVTFVVLDEADRIFDMGFSSQIGAILSAVRPDRQTVLFSATFPKTVELVARKALQFPIEVLVGGRSVASDNVTQYAELVEEENKFLRLLQLLGEQADDGKKVIVFVGTQAKADSIFEQLLRCGYLSLSLHGGKEQDDRDSTLSDFKSHDGPNLLVATGVAGRGLDVPSVGCVINYSAPNHLEAYVHQVGRTGRANKMGVAYTFVNSTDEAAYAPIVTRALTEAGQAENIAPALKTLAESFVEKVKRGEAKYAGSGFKGKGYSYDSSELSEAQKLAHLEKRQALIEAGLLDPDDEDPLSLDANSKSEGNGNHNEPDAAASWTSKGTTTNAFDDADGLDGIEVPDILTPELLALPGMKQAILKKAGILSEPAGGSNHNDNDSILGKIVQLGPNHFLQELEINDYPREARWKATQKETTSRLQDEFQTAVTLKGSYFPPGKTPGPNERRLYLHLEATSERVLKNCVLEIQRLLNEETLRVSGRLSQLAPSSHKYSVL